MAETLTIGTAQRATLPGWPAAGKTGTSQDFRDAWFIGYTAHLVTGVWLGNDDGTSTKHVTGGSLPVEIWSRVMRSAHQGVPVASLPGTAGGNLFSGFFGGGGSRPTPPAAVQPVAANGASTTGSGGGLDNWFLNTLFGRR
jgi:penicillin-binding protein 1A